jgi:hypothetical protein
VIAVALLLLAQTADPAVEKLRSFYARPQLASVDFDLTRDTEILAGGRVLDPAGAWLPVGRTSLRLVNKRLGQDRTVSFDVKPGRNFFTHRFDVVSAAARSATPAP